MSYPERNEGLIYRIEDRPSAPRTIVLGLQHVLVMFAAMIGSPLAIARALELSQPQTGAMVSACMLGCGVGTAISAAGLGAIGGRLPLVLGIFSIFISPTISVAKHSGMASVSGALLIGGFVIFLLSPILGRARTQLPAVVVGAILLVTGTTLIRIAAGLLLRGSSSTIALGLLTLLITVILGTCGTNLRVIAVFASCLIAYGIAAVAGMIDFNALEHAPLIAVPAILPFGVEWPPPGALATMLVCFFAAAVETSVQAVAVARICGVDPAANRIRGAIAADGIGSLVSALFGGLPLTSYSQNIGAVALTGVGSRVVVMTCGAILVALSFLPGVSLAISLTPSPVIGGALLFLFGTISVLGIQTAGDLQKPRDRTIVMVSLALGLAVSFAGPALTEILPAVTQPFLGEGIIIGTIVALTLNILLPDPSGDHVGRNE
jgi:NCS2 family nucleobase:cation symporter-2